MDRKPTYEELEQRVSELDKKLLERRQVENELLFKENIINFSSSAIATCDLEGNMTYGNPAFLKAWGFADPKEFLGKSFWEYWMVKHRLDEIMQALKGEGIWSGEIQARRKDGTLFDVQVSAATVFDREGRPIALTSTSIDVTARKQAEKRLQKIYEEMEDRVKERTAELEKEIAERKQTEENLLLFRSLIDQSNDATFIIEPETGYFLDGNEKAWRGLGYTRDELLNLSVMDIEAVIPDDFSWQQHVAEVRKKRFMILEGEHKRKDGTTFPVEINAKVIVLAEKGYMVAVARNISERKRAEEDLRKSEISYREIFNASNEALFVHDMETGAILDVNQTMCDMFGYTHEEAVNLSVGDLSQGKPPYTMDHARQWVRKAVEEGPQRFEWWAKRKNGELFWDETNLKLATIGGQDRLLAFVSDITERKQAETALQESEEKYRNLVEYTLDWVWSCDVEGRHTFSNRAVKDLLGYEVHEVVGAPAFESMHIEDRQRAQELLKEAVEQKRGWKGTVIRWRHKDGSVKFFETKAQPILDDKGNLAGFSGIDRDITEVKLAQEEKARVQKQLQQAQKMEAIGTLAGGIAHDFNNILAAIIGYTGMMEMFDVPEDSPMRARIKEVLKAANRAKDLVQQILTFSRQTEQESKPVQLNYIVKEALKFLRASLPTTIEFRQNIADEEFIALADPTQMHQVLMNLCTNAGHAMLETGGKLKVELSALNLDAQSVKRFPELKPGPHLKMTVSDTGHGMTPEIMERLFDPFFTTKKPGEGTGMGLAVVHGIVKSHEGVITVDSELGEGTIFQIIIPRIEMGAVEPATKTAPSMPTGTERILFIDDEHSLVTIVQEILERLGYDVVSKTSSREALELIRSQPKRFDLVITDQTMPHMTGIELAQKILRIRSDIPVILCTGHSEAATPERIKAVGIRELINKPLDPSGLARTVRKVLDSRIED